MDPTRAARTSSSTPEVSVETAKVQNHNDIEVKTSNVAAKLKSIQKPEAPCSFRASNASPARISSVFAGAVGRGRLAESCSLKGNHAVKRMSKDELDALVAKKSEIVDGWAANGLTMIDVTERGSVESIGLQHHWTNMSFDKEYLSGNVGRIVPSNKHEGYDGEFQVHSNHKFAGQDSCFINGMKLKVVVDITDEEIDEIAEQIVQYQLLDDLISQQERIESIAEEKVVSNGGPVILPQSRTTRTVPVEVQGDPSLHKVFASKMTELALLMSVRKEERSEERRAQQKDEEHQRIQAEVVREGVKKEIILEEAVRYTNKNRIAP